MQDMSPEPTAMPMLPNVYTHTLRIIWHYYLRIRVRWCWCKCHRPMFTLQDMSVYRIVWSFERRRRLCLIYLIAFNQTQKSQVEWLEKISFAHGKPSHEVPNFTWWNFTIAQFTLKHGFALLPVHWLPAFWKAHCSFPPIDLASVAARWPAEG